MRKYSTTSDVFFFVLLVIWGAVKCLSSPVDGWKTEQTSPSDNHHHDYHHHLHQGGEIEDALQAAFMESKARLTEAELKLQAFDVPIHLLQHLGPVELARSLYMPGQFMTSVPQEIRQAITLRISTYVRLYHGDEFGKEFVSERDRIGSMIGKRLARKKLKEKQDEFRQLQGKSAGEYEKDGEEGEEGEGEGAGARRQRLPYKARSAANRKIHPIAQVDSRKKMEIRSTIMEVLDKYRINLNKYDDPKALAVEFEKPGGLMSHVPEAERTMVASRIGDYIEYRKNRHYRQAWARKRIKINANLQSASSNSKKGAQLAHPFPASENKHQTQFGTVEDHQGYSQTSSEPTSFVYDPSFGLDDMDNSSTDADFGFVHGPGDADQYLATYPSSYTHMPQVMPSETPYYHSPMVAQTHPYHQHHSEELEEMHYLLRSPEAPHLWR